MKVPIFFADRAERPAFYAGAAYAALTPTGAGADRLFAFERRLGPDRLVVVVPRLPAACIAEETIAVRRGFFDGTTVTAADGVWRDVVTGGVVDCERGVFDVGTLFRELPFAVLRSA